MGKVEPVSLLISALIYEYKQAYGRYDGAILNLVRMWEWGPD
jgi:hypothetical protein